VIFVFAIAILTGAQACMTGAGRRHERSSEARRLVGLLFFACAVGDVVVGLVAWASRDALAEAIGLVASVFLVLGIFRWSRSMRPAH
jgi:hypothetical protein